MRPAGFSPRAFTLVEMVVVIAIIVVILALVVPAASTLWEQRKQADAVNAIQGLLTTTRAAALEANGADAGFFAFLDDRGVQRFVTIQQDPQGLLNPAWQNVFVVTEDRSLSLPAPLRVVPRYVVDPPAGPATPDTFSDEELANNDFNNPPGNQKQRHRNFFTMVYSPDGVLVINRDVLIQDENSNPGSGLGQDELGDRTELPVGPGPPATPTTQNFYDAVTDTPIPFDAGSPGVTIGFLIRDAENNAALNFPSVDGLLVYDDSLLNEIADPAEKRTFLLRTAQPLYVSRLTGTVILGPVGESEAP